MHIVITLLLSVLILSGCNTTHRTGNATGTVIGAAVGAGAAAILGAPRSLMTLAGIGGGAVGYYTTTLRYDAGGIIQTGGQVYKVGDYVGIYLPSHRIFEPNTDHFLPQAAPALHSVAAVLQRYPHNNIMISGNTSGFFRARWERILSEKRAKKIASYLWSRGITNNRRKLDYVGFGNFFPISQDYTNDGIRENSRIQITSYPPGMDISAVRYKAPSTVPAPRIAAPRCGFKNEC